ncbi:MAG: tyrosine--tRNA ligase [Candidatus Diapherotrites archaeon]|nr:tyrosine--tRNA ligase [Candidatus Diapherotrites archaeon]
MDVEERMKLITSPPAEEIITPEELRRLLEEKKHPRAYDGFEPSGIPHIATGLMRAEYGKDLERAGIEFVVLLADWHAFLNNKLGGDIEKIREAGRFFAKVWELLGWKPKIVWASEMVEDPSYWETLMRISKELTISRIKRAAPIMGRKEAEMQHAAFLLYPLMQSTDIKYLDVDIAQLGMDQRRVNVMYREVAEKMGWKKPVLIHHHLLMGLQAGKRMDYSREEDQLEFKMSKSKPETAIYVTDSPEDIRRKLRNAYCPAGEIENNPVIDIVRNIILRREGMEFEVRRPEKYGGDVIYTSFEELAKDFREGRLHPLDLKNAVADWLIEKLEPVRKYVEAHPEVLEPLKEVTR